MKRIIFPLIKGRSGGDVYFENIKECIKDDLDADIFYFKDNFFYKILPFLLGRRDYQCEIFHCTSNEILWNLRKKKQKKIISILHLFYEKNYDNYLSFSQKVYYNTFYKKYLKKSLPYADKIISISKYTQKRLKELFGYDSEVIYPCIDTEKFRPDLKKRDNKRIRILYSGNSSKRKGFDLLPKIIDKLGSGFELYCTGLRDYDKKFKNIKYFGKLSKEDLINAYNDCDIFLFPSRLEGFGLSVAEAMACGKPCIVTNCSSLPELIDDEKGGFLCERDNINDFVKKIKILAKNKKLRENMGGHNREKVIKCFSFEALKEKYIKLYKEVG